jgi:hypothetical protein
MQNVLLASYLFSFFFLQSTCAALAQKTVVSIHGDEFWINDKPTYKNRFWNGKKIQGLLMNSRMVQGVFDDLNQVTVANFAYPDTQKWSAARNNQEFVENMPLWKSYGLNALTLNMQGGSPIGYGNWDFENPGFNPDGSLIPAYMERLNNILKKADELEMVVILGLFYFGQDQRLTNEAAIKNATTNIINWLFDKGYQNVLIEINNETQSKIKHYDHDILLYQRVHELINLAKSIQRNGYRYLVTTSFPAQTAPTQNVLNTCDFVLFHANALRNTEDFKNHIIKVKAAVGARTIPIVINEDDNHFFDADSSHFNIAIDKYISWGFFDYRKKEDPDLSKGYQTIPVDWGINSKAKEDFFNKVGEVTGTIKTPTEAILIDSVWAANSVGFDLQTVDDKQFVVYYDKNRMMTVATRTIGESNWTRKTLGSQLYWDSHNYAVLSLDKEGYVHVSGNMHADPLIYFKSSKPYDVKSIQKVSYMIGEDENRMTYPKFFYDKSGELFYSYRSGGSGNGTNYVNRYDTKTKTWERYLSEPLFEGKNGGETRSSYYQFTKDNEGNFHYIWMWRWTPMVETCHQLCYATSSDLKNWKNAAGETVTLPLRPDDKRLIIDNAPTGGMHNGRHSVITDKENQPIIVYVKYDEQGFTQLYVAKFTQSEWKITQLSDWDFRWKFNGSGDQMTIGGNFDVKGISTEGFLIIDWETEKNESGTYVVNLNKMALTNSQYTLTTATPPSLSESMSNVESMSVRLAEDRSNNERSNIRYFLKWEAMPKSHRKSAPAQVPSGPLSPLFNIKITD